MIPKKNFPNVKYIKKKELYKMGWKLHMACSKVQLFIPKYENESFEIWLLLNVTLVTLGFIALLPRSSSSSNSSSSSTAMRYQNCHPFKSRLLLILHYFSATARGARRVFMVQYCTKPKLGFVGVALYWL
jgi:hypothetical protein